MKRTPLKRKSPLKAKSADKIKTERIPLAIRRPSEMKPEKPAVRIMADGREICNLLTKAGRDEYERRKFQMRDLQGKQCCLKGFIKECPGFLAIADTTFEHELGRMAGKRDDRVFRPNPRTGELERINGAAHALCNTLKGSRRFNYNGPR